MITIYDYLNETIDIINDEIVINYTINSIDKTSLDTRFGAYNKKFKPYTKKTDDKKVLIKSVYKFTKENSQIIRKLKTTKDIESIRSFVNRTSIFLYSQYKNEHIDMIVLEQSDNLLTKEIAKELSKRMNLENPIPMDIIYKQSPKYIKIKYDDPNITKGIIDYLEQQIKNSIRIGHFNIKTISPEFRKFIYNTHQINNFYIHKISGKNILLIDDIITSSKTITEIADILFYYEADNLYACSIFKKL